MKFLIAALLVSSIGSAQIYDLLLKNGRVIDPANHRDAQLDVAVIGNEIASVAPHLPAAHARIVVDATGYIVTPGLIDTQADFRGHLKPDYNTLRYGVTTVVDTGHSCEDFEEFKKEVVDHAKVRILARLWGDENCKFRNDDVVLGLMFRMKESDADLFRAPFADPPIDTISPAMTWSNILIPRANMSNSMSIYLNRGLTEQQIIERVTSNAARFNDRPQLGNFNDGAVADIALLEIQHGKFGFLDSAQKRIDGTRRFHCVMTVRNGAIVWDSEGLSIPDTSKAGPYTNFK